MPSHWPLRVVLLSSVVLGTSACYSSQQIRVRVLDQSSKAPVADAEAEIDYPYDHAAWIVPRPPRSRGVSGADGLIVLRLYDFHPARLRADESSHKPPRLISSI